MEQPLKTSESNTILLLTASVNVGGMVFMALQDVKIREQHYLDAIRFYYENTSLPILLVENTNHDFTARLPEDIRNSNRVEFLTFPGNNFPKERGKGYGELESMSHAVAHSKMINEKTVIIKVTGRYKVINIRDFVKAAMNNKYHQCQVLYFKGQRKAFSGIFCISKRFIEHYLIPNHELMNDTKGVYFEHVLATTLLDYVADGSNYSLLPSFPRLSGISGTENIQHRTNNYSFWLRRQLLYKVVKVNYQLLDKLIRVFFQG